MDSVQGQYMRINQMLMCIIGQWPYQEVWEKFLIQLVFVPAVFSQAVLQVNSPQTPVENKTVKYNRQGSNEIE